jgi:DNA-binding XRE family transcriptional regulator
MPIDPLMEMLPAQKRGFAQRLRDERKRRHLTQAAMASALDITPRCMATAERLGEPLMLPVDQLARLLKVRSDWLFWGTGPASWDPAPSTPTPAMMTLREMAETLAGIIKELHPRVESHNDAVICDDLRRLEAGVRAMIG